MKLLLMVCLTLYFVGDVQSMPLNEKIQSDLETMDILER